MGGSLHSFTNSSPRPGDDEYESYLAACNRYVQSRAIIMWAVPVLTPNNAAYYRWRDRMVR